MWLTCSLLDVCRQFGVVIYWVLWGLCTAEQTNVHSFEGLHEAPWSQLEQAASALLCILSAVLGCTRRGESKVLSCKGERKKIVVLLISQLYVIFKLYLKAPDSDDHSVTLPVLVRGVAAMCPELGHGYSPSQLGMWDQPRQLWQVPLGASSHFWEQWLQVLAP